MAAFIPIAKDLSASFVRPLELGIPAPLKTESEVWITRAGLRVHRHVATAECTADEWLALRSLFESTE